MKQLVIASLMVWWCLVLCLWCDDAPLVIVSLVWWCVVGDCVSDVMMCRWWLCLWCDDVSLVINCVSGVIMWRWWLCLWCDDVSLMIVSGMMCRWLCVWCDEVLLVIISLMVWWCVVNDCVINWRKRSPTFWAKLHLPALDLFWANLRVQYHLPLLYLAWTRKWESNFFVRVQLTSLLLILPGLANESLTSLWESSSPPSSWSRLDPQMRVFFVRVHLTSLVLISPGLWLAMVFVEVLLYVPQKP